MKHLNGSKENPQFEKPSVFFQHNNNHTNQDNQEQIDHDELNKRVIPLFTKETPDYHNKEFNLEPTNWYTYFNPDGSIVGCMVRWMIPQKDGTIKKEIRPYVHINNKWKSTGFPNPCPLYNLTEILARPNDTILIVEGEKTVNAAKNLFPNFIATTSAHGSNSAYKTEWSYLNQRNVIICPDFDVVGTKYADDVVELARTAGASSIHYLPIQDVFRNFLKDVDLEKGYDLADGLNQGLTAGSLSEQDLEHFFIPVEGTIKEIIQERVPNFFKSKILPILKECEDFQSDKVKKQSQEEIDADLSNRLLTAFLTYKSTDLEDKTTQEFENIFKRGTDKYPNLFNDLELLIKDEGFLINRKDKTNFNLSKLDQLFTYEDNETLGIPKGFTVQNDGIYYEKLVNNPETNEKETRNFKLCSPLIVTALTRDDNGSNWGRILELEDPDQIKKEFIMPMEMLAGSGDELREELLSRGLRLTSGQESRRKLEDYISSSQPQERVLCVETVGWFQSQYILPHKTYRFEDKERIVYQSKGIPPKPIKIKGTIDEWETNIGQDIVGNPLLILSACAAMAPLFLYLLKEENCMFHLFGSSSIGKTTAAHVARSMWGIPMYSWRTTDNAAEYIAQNANDGLVIFDEIAEVDAKAADNMSYMLGNGSGKSRSNRDGNAKPQKKFRLIALSTGEIRLESKLRDIGKSQKAGQSVRFIELEADAKEGNGIFKNLHEFQDGNSLSTHLRQAADQFCGTPIDSLICFLTASPERQDEAVEVIKDLREDWLVKYASAYTEGQVQRCAKKFALLAAVGEFAVHTGLLNGFSLQADNEPSLGEVSEAMFDIFKSWLKNRGGDESHELIEIKDQLVNYIMTHGSSRFENSWDGQDKVINRVGFRRKIDGYTQYYFEKNQFKKEILQGKSSGYIQRLIDDGYLTGSKYGDTIRLTENSLMRLLVVSPDILNKGVENES
jgi:uncharacterized protein (DUF927 family)